MASEFSIYVKVKLLLGLLLFCTTAPAGTITVPSLGETIIHRPVLYLTIGSEHYLTVPPDDMGSPRFQQVRGIRNGARRIATSLSEGGAAWGMSLLSRRNQYVTREDVYEAADRLAKESENYEDPMLFVYISGHGLQNQFSFTQYFIPGNLVIDISTVEKVDPYDRIYPFSVPIIKFIREVLENSGLDYVVLVDLCRNTDEAPFDFGEMFSDKDRSEGALAAAELVGGFWRRQNIFLDSPYPVVFAAEPGEFATTVADPFDPSGTRSIGPLAQRFSLVEEFLRSSGLEMTVVDLLYHLYVDDTLDSSHPLAFSASSVSDDRLLLTALISQNGLKTDPETVYGSGSSAVYCCKPEDEPNDRWAVRNYDVPIDSILEILEGQ